MTTEDLLEALISSGVKAYKKLNKNTPEGRKLNRHESVTIEGVEFTCWREYAVYKTAEYISEIIPPEQVEVTLDGNNSVLKITCDDNEQQDINRKLYLFLKKEDII